MSIHLQSLSQPHVSPYSYYSPNVTNLYCIHEFNQACLFISPTPITHSGLIPRCKDGLKKKVVEFRLYFEEGASGMWWYQLDVVCKKRKGPRLALRFSPWSFHHLRWGRWWKRHGRHLIVTWDTCEAADWRGWRQLAVWIGASGKTPVNLGIVGI